VATAARVRGRRHVRCNDAGYVFERGATPVVAIRPWIRGVWITAPMHPRERVKGRPGDAVAAYTTFRW